jgi:hypothetical protein
MGGDWQGAKEIHDLQKGHRDQMAVAVRASVDTLECGMHARRSEHAADDKQRMNEIFQDLKSDQPDPAKRMHSRTDTQPILEAWHEAFHAQMALHRKDVDDAEKRAQAAIQLARRRGDLFGEGVLSDGGSVLEEARTQAAWGEIQLKRGDPDGKDRLRDALRTFEDAGLTWEVARIRPLI